MYFRYNKIKEIVCWCKAEVFDIHNIYKSGMNTVKVKVDRMIKVVEGFEYSNFISRKWMQEP